MVETLGGNARPILRRERNPSVIARFPDGLEGVAFPIEQSELVGGSAGTWQIDQNTGAGDGVGRNPVGDQDWFARHIQLAEIEAVHHQRARRLRRSAAPKEEQVAEIRIVR